jgi:hypothetical protein
MSVQHGDRQPVAWAALDSTVGMALAAFTLAYLYWWPRDLNPFDEALLLYEAKRILRGDVPYRDFFEIITPGSLYVFAGAFSLLGVSLGTARALMAAVHVAIELTVYAVCRRLGVRRGLAVIAALAHLALGYVQLPIASAHWLGTLLMMVSLALCVSDRWRRRPVSWGVTIGLLIVVQQQKGVVFATACGTVLIVDALIDRTLAGWPLRAAMADLARFAGGIAMVVLPVVVALLVRAGAWPVYDALLRFPLENYPSHRDNQVPWGFFVWWAIGPLWWVAEINSRLPYLAPLTLVRGMWQWRTEGASDRARALLVLGIYLGAAALSVVYHPDVAHLGLIACVGAIVAAETLEAMLRAGERIAPLRRAAGLVLTAVLLVLVIEQLAVIGQWRRHTYSVRAETPFGTVDFTSRNDLVLLDGLRERLARESTREVFAYPYSSLYLLAPADNPTRFEILMRGYNSPAQFDEALFTLESRQVPYAVVLSYWVNWATDPVVKYLGQHYEMLALPYDAKGTQPFALFRRKP